MSIKDNVDKINQTSFQDIVDMGFLSAINLGIGFTVGTKFGLTPAFEMATKTVARNLKPVSWKFGDEPPEYTVYRITTRALDKWGLQRRISNDQREKLIPLVHSLIMMNTFGEGYTRGKAGL